MQHFTEIRLEVANMASPRAGLHQGQIVRD